MFRFAENSIHLILAFQLLPGVGYAQNENERSHEPIKISEEIVVTATRYEERVASVPANVTVVTREDIINSTAQDIPNLLRTVAGVQVTDIAGNQRNYRVDLRGFGETAAANTLVLVDGRRVSQADLSGTDWFQIPLSRVERIEIMRGGRGSVLYGDNASGGVINIITRSASRLTGGVQIRGGSYETFRAGGNFGESQKDFGFAVSGDYFRTSGYRENSHVNGGDLGASVDVSFNESFNLGVSGGYHSDTAGLPGALKESDFEKGASRTESFFPDNFSSVDDYYFLIRPGVSFLTSSLARIDFSFRRRSTLFFSSFEGGNFEGDTGIDTITFGPQIVLEEPLRGLPNIFTVGFDHIQSQEDIRNASEYFGEISIGTFDLQKKNTSFFAHDEIFPLENLSISGGYRHDRVTYSFSPSAQEHARFNLNLFTTGANYRFHRESHLYLNFSRSFRYPLLDELFDFFSNSIDPELRPQTSDDFELGLRHYFTDSFYSNLNYFLVETQNEIFFNPVGGPFGFGANENFDGNTRRTGIEVAAGTNAGILSLQGSYTFTNARVRGGQYVGNWIPAVPKNRFSLNSTLYLTNRLTVVLEGSYVGKRPFESDWSGRFGYQENHFHLNSRVSYNWRRSKVYCDINNLLNQEYSEYGVLASFSTERAFYPSPKANFIFGFSVDF